MPEYTCKQCKFSTKLRSNYLRHLDTNKHLKRIKAQTIEVKKNTVNYVSDNKKQHDSMDLTIMEQNMVGISEEQYYCGFICKYCCRHFSSRQSRNRHQSKFCKHNDRVKYEKLAGLLNKKEQQMNEDKEEFYKDKIDKLEKQIEKLMDHLKIQNINNGVQIQGDQNNTVNLQLLNYNQTDYEFLNDKDFIKCIQQTNHCVKALIEKVHFNKNKPENMNIYISCIKGKFVMVYRDNKWQIRDRKQQIDDLYESNELMLENWYEEYNDKYPEIIKSFTRYLKNKDEDDDFINNVKNEILLMLYNKRDLVESHPPNEEA